MGDLIMDATIAQAVIAQSVGTQSASTQSVRRTYKRRLVSRKARRPLCRHPGCKNTIGIRCASGYCSECGHKHRCVICAEFIDAQNSSNRGGKRGKHSDNARTCDACRIVTARIEWINQHTWRGEVEIPERQRRAEIYAEMVEKYGQITFIEESNSGGNDLS